MTMSGKPTSTDPASFVPPKSKAVPDGFRRIYRAFVAPPQSNGRGIELTAFVHAMSHEGAIRKITRVIAAMEFGSTPESVAERIYNCASADELIAEGRSEDIEDRLLETGWCGNQPTHFVEHPLVLMPDPTPLLRVWARLCQRAAGQT